MRLYVATPIIRNLAQTFNHLDKKIAGNLARADSFVRKHPVLSYVLGATQENQEIAPFINAELIAITTAESIRIIKKKGFCREFSEYVEDYSKSDPLAFGFDDRITETFKVKANPFSSETYEVPGHQILDRKLDALFKKIRLKQPSW